MKIYFNSTFNEIVDKRDTSDLWIKGNSGNILYSYFDGLDLSNEFIKCRLVIQWSNGETTNELVMNKSIVRSCFYITLPKLKESGNANFTLRIYIGDELHQTCMFTRNIKESVDASDDTDISNEEYQALLNAIEELSSQGIQIDVDETLNADSNNPVTNKAITTKFNIQDNQINSNSQSIQDLNVNKQDYLSSGINIKTINGISILGSGNVQVGEGGDADLSEYYTKTEANNRFATLESLDTTDEDVTALENRVEDLEDNLGLTINSTNSNRYNLNLVKKGALKYKSLASQTFIFNNTPLGVVTFDKWFNYSVNFTSNGTSYNSISIFMNEVVVEIKFGATSVYTTSSGWANDSYRTVQFADGTDIANNDLIIILQCLGSFKSSSGESVDTYSKEEIDDLLLTKQASLVSGTNIKTINGNSLLGSGNIVVSGSADLSNYYTKTQSDNKFATIESMSATDEDIAELANRVTTLENAGGSGGQTTQVFRGSATTGTLNIDRTTENGMLIFECVVTGETSEYGIFQLVAPVYDYEQENYVAQTLIRAYEGGGYLPCKVVLTFNGNTGAKFTATNCNVTSAFWCR